FDPTLSANSSSNLFTFSPNGAIQLVSNASFTNACSYPSSLMRGEESNILSIMMMFLSQQILIPLIITITYLIPFLVPLLPSNTSSILLSFHHSEVLIQSLFLQSRTFLQRHIVHLQNHKHRRFLVRLRLEWRQLIEFHHRPQFPAYPNGQTLQV